MASALERWIDLREGEARPALLALGALFGIVSGHTLLETARDALFLGQLPPSRLPLMYAALAGISLVVVRLNGAFVRRFGRRNALIITLMGAAYGTVMLFLLRPHAATVYALYLWSGTLSMVMVAQFWMLIGSAFTVTQGKRLFGPIAAGGVMGAVLGATVAAVLLQLVDVRRLLPFAAGSFLATAALLTSMANDNVNAMASATVRGEGAKTQSRASLWADPYLKRLTIQTILIGAAVLVADYLFKSVVAREVPQAQLGTFLARYYAVLNALSLVVQLVIASAAVKRLGVIGATAVLPLALLGGGIGILASGGSLLLVLLTKGADGALRHSLHRVTSELTWLPLPDEVRSTAKSVVDTSVTRVVQAATAGVILALAAVDLDTPWVLAGLLVALAGMAIAGSMSLRAPYVDLFRTALGRNEMPAGGEFAIDLNGAEIAMEALSSREPVRAVAAMDLLASQRRARLIPALILYHDSPDVLVRALAVVCTPDRRDWIPLAERLLEHPDAEVRAAAVFAVVGTGNVGVVAARIDDTSPRVRATTAFVLAERERPDDPAGDPRVEALFGVAGPAGVSARSGLLEVIANRGGPAWTRAVHRAAADGDPGLDAALARAAERLREPSLLPLLIARMGSRLARSEVRDAIVAYGDAGLAALKAAMSDATSSSHARQHVPLTVAKFRTQAAADYLVELLTTDSSGRVRFRALKALVSMLEDVPVVIDANRVVMELRRNLMEYFRLLALAGPFESTAGGDVRTSAARELLVSLLRDKQSQAIQRVFSVLQLLIRSENLRRVQLALASDDPRARANAAEFLDNLTLRFATGSATHEESRALIQLLSDDLTAVERLARARPMLGAVLPEWPEDVDGALGLLIRERDAGIATIAAEYALVSGSRRLVGEVRSLSTEQRFLTSLSSIFGELPNAI